MNRSLHRLTATKIAGRLTPGYYSDGGNLYFRVAPGGTKGWIFRFKRDGRRSSRDMGLGAFPTISLARARQLAAECRALVAERIDPIDRRKAQRAEARVENANTITFDDCAAQYMAAHADGWRSARHRQQWASTLATYASPIIGRLPVRAIDTGLVMRVLAPMWTSASTPETASRLRGRIESVLSWAAVRGYRTGENPARWRGHLDHLLPAKSKVRAVKHHAAMNFLDVPVFWQELRLETDAAALALAFLIATAVRASEAVCCTWDEIDLDARAWTISAARMKGGKAHRVPLSAAAMAVLEEAQRTRRSDYVFPGRLEGRPLSRDVVGDVLRRLGRDVTVHGFRSSFSTFAHERTAHSSHTIELCLAHTVGTEVERAYMRADMLGKRRQLMDDWSRFVVTPIATSNAVVPIGTRRR